MIGLSLHQRETILISRVDRSMSKKTSLSSILHHIKSMSCDSMTDLDGAHNIKKLGYGIIVFDDVFHLLNMIRRSGIWLTR